MTLVIRFKNSITPHRKGNDPVNDVLKDILEFIKSNPGIKKTAIITHVGKSKATLTRYLKQLVDKNLIEYKGTPVPIRLKSTLTTLDLRHFIWNIAERLGCKKDYTGEVRAIFIKRMFPDVMRDIEIDSIRNFKFQPDTGNIVIDEPDKGDYHFHYEKFN